MLAAREGWNRRKVALGAIVALATPVLLVASLVCWLVFLRAAWTWYDGPLPAGELVSGPQSTLVFDHQGRAVFSFAAEQRTDVPLDRVSPRMIAAAVAAEDRRFFSHRGLDPIRIAGAAWRNFRAGRILQGGSTITQQLARTVHLGPQRTWRRKIREALLATDLEARLTKPRILEAYLNSVYFGEGFYGVEAASRGYFGKPAADLTDAEAALLAGLIRSPAHSPVTSPNRARGRRNVVLRAMRAAGTITPDDYSRAVATPLAVVKRTHAGSLLAQATLTHGDDATDALCGMYFFEEVRRELVAMFGNDRVLRGGLRVYTTVDVDLQRTAEAAIRGRIATLGKKRRLLARELQGALVALDVKSGDVRAIVGGRDFHRSRYDRATQARRQPGSAFKPIVFAAALERGFGPGSLLTDLETPIESAQGPWLPSGEHEAAQYTLRRALKVSSNRASAQLMHQIGVSPVISYAHRLGIASELPAVPSLALGTGGVTLLELVSAYMPFAAQGMWAKPTFIRRVEDRDGNVIWQSPHIVRQAISPSTAYLMSSMLRDVIAGGTGYLARSMGFRRPAAGKTGTTDDFADAWFVGYTPRLVAGVWFGFDRPRTIFNGGFGGIVAVPAWTTFMLRATAGDPQEWYDVPSDVEKRAICRLSGALATDECRHATWPVEWVAGSTEARTPAQVESPVYEDYFAIGTGPAELCPVHRPLPASVGDAALQPASLIRQ